jgi:hypothetical protein
MLRFTTLIAVSLAAAQPAHAAPHMEYGEGDGERFAYSTELHSSGVIHISGVMLATGDRFALDVQPNGHVEGKFGSVPVEYDVGRRTRDQVAAQLGDAPAVATASLPN